MQPRCIAGYGRAGIGWIWTCFLLLAVGLAGLPAFALAADWEADLYGGGQVTVDPDTNRAMVNKYGVQTPLWDGVHRLQDGSTIIIRSGIVVPNKAILDARSLPDLPPKAETEADWKGRSIVGYSPCQKLVARVCGAGVGCAGTQGCMLAQQLLDMEWQERRAGLSPGLMTPGSGQCLDAERDQAFFASCGAMPGASLPPRAEDIGSAAPRVQPPCDMLVEKACGRNAACANGPGCDAARQLQRMAAESVDDPNPVDGHCLQGLQDTDFFPRCRR